MQEISIVVLGAIGVGKSTFVRCVMDITRPTISQMAIKKVSLDGVVSTLRLLELQSLDLEYSEKFGLKWPTMNAQGGFSRIDGAFLLCDITDKSSLTDVPRILHMFRKIALPTIFVSTKCDTPIEKRQVDHQMIRSICQNVDGIEFHQCSLKSPETHKRCVSVMLRNIMAGRVDSLSSTTQTQQQPAFTNSQAQNVPKASSKKLEKPKHGRAASEYSAIQIRKSQFEALETQPPGKDACGHHLDRSSTDSGISESLSPTSPVNFKDCSLISSKDDCESQTLITQENVSDNALISESSSTPNLCFAMANSFLEMYDEGEEQDLSRILSNAKYNHMAKENSSGELGASFEELIDRLLSPPMSKADYKFVSAFLCLYRRFAGPSDLLFAIVSRFEKLNNDHQPQIIRVTSQLYYLNVLAQWASDYPGDFAHSLPRRSLTKFLAALANTRIFAVAVKEITLHLDSSIDDDDLGWESDTRRSRASTIESLFSNSSIRSATSALNIESSTEETNNNHEFDEFANYRVTRHSSSPSIASSESKSGTQSTGSFQILLNSTEKAQRQAKLLTPAPKIPLSKVQWHEVMDSSEEDIARELTRIDWIMLSSLKPRDLVRHVCLSAHERERCKSLLAVNRMINHFNHIAFWAANLILLRDKPKHRAKALEKFMRIASKLRHLNNYSSLGAIIAGINGTAVHRLAQTRELIPLEARKQFMSLEILMGTQKGHFAYRLAWANTSSARIPFLPLHQRDLLFAEEGNQNYLDGNINCINWRKFEIMGDIIIGIQQSQGIPYSDLNQNEELRHLILDGIFSNDEDELYDRSLQVEPPEAGENSRKRFNWLQR